MVRCGSGSRRILSHPEVENHFCGGAILRDAKGFLKLAE
jgi:hypothetical protein